MVNTFTARPLVVGSLFAGIGGFDLAARWLGWRTAWYSEVDAYASAVMRRHFPEAVNHGDITQINGYNVEPVEVLCGGFPCQDISRIGTGAGITGARSGLWSHFARLVGEIRPRYVVAENASTLRTRGLDRVLGDLLALGYNAEWHCIPACHVGAPHQRDRLWLVAVADTVRAGLEGHAGHGDDGDEPGWLATFAAGSTSTPGVRGGADAAAWWATDAGILRVANGVPDRVDRIRCAGNALVPQVAAMIFHAINAREAVRAAAMERAA